MAGSTKIYKVIIVGGGVSGLAAASKLIKNGVKNCLLLEAQSNLGGRICTVEHGKHILEYGAQWIHGEEDNVVYSFAKEHDLLDEESTSRLNSIGETLFVREDSLLVSEDIVRIFQMQMSTLSEEGEKELRNHKGSVGTFYTKKFMEENNLGETGMELLDWYGRFQCCIDGTDTWYDASCIGSTVYEECPGNQVINWKKGYKTLISHFQDTIPKEVIRLRSPVNKIRWKTTAKSFEEIPLVEVELSSGEVLRGEHVIVTPSLAVLKATHESLFEPELPARKIKAINGLGIDVVDKIYLEFPTKWWDGYDGFSLLRQNSQTEIKQENWEKSILGFYEIFNQSHILCAWLTGKAAKEMEKCSKDEVKEKCMSLLRSYLSTHYDIPEPTWWDRTQWCTNPYIRGSYSFRSVTSEELNVTAQDLAYPLCSDKKETPLVCFAGEATHHKYYSTVHGAVETGWREADRLLALIRKNSKEISDALHYDVIIVGAGASGLAAAKELEANGITSICILEASNRYGGRVKTEFPPSGGFVDLGAQWIHGEEENSLYEIVASQGLISNEVSVDGQGYFATDGGEPVDCNLLDEVLTVCNDIKNEAFEFASSGRSPPSSMGHFLRNRFEEYLKSRENTSRSERKMMEDIFQWDNRWERIDNACDSLYELSVKRWGDFVPCGGHYNMNPKYGMMSLIQYLKSGIKSTIKFEHQVLEISYAKSLREVDGKGVRRDDGSTPVRITCSNGKRYECNHVIVTCSLGYLKKHKDHLFRPPLPSLVDKAISNFGFGVIDKIFLEFEEPFWGPEFKGLHLVWSGNEVPDFDRSSPNTKLRNGHTLKPEDFWYRAISGFDPAFGHKSMLCGWIGGAEAEFMETLTEEEVSRVCGGLLRRFTGHLLPDPIKVYRSQWATNDLILGSYSHRTPSFDEMNEDPVAVMNVPLYARTDANVKIPILVFAGEAYSHKYYSTVHGAISNGKEQAKHYIDFINRNWKENVKLKSKL